MDKRNYGKAPSSQKFTDSNPSIEKEETNQMEIVTSQYLSQFNFEK